MVATLQLNAKALGETDVASKDVMGNVWRPRGIFCMCVFSIFHMLSAILIVLVFQPSSGADTFDFDFCGGYITREIIMGLYQC